MRNKNIKNILWKTHSREEGYINIRFEHQHYDCSFVYIEDVLGILGIPEELLHRILNQSQIEKIYHPRNNLKIIHKDFIPKIQIEVCNEDLVEMGIFGITHGFNDGLDRIRLDKESVLSLLDNI